MNTDLKITGLRAGLIVNFKHAKLEWKRVVLQGHQPSKRCVSARGSYLP